jgi:hypothetical protein
VSSSLTVTAVETVGSKQVIEDWTIWSWEVVTIFRVQETERKRITDLRRELKKLEFFSLTIYQTDDRQIDYYERIGLIKR